MDPPEKESEVFRFKDSALFCAYLAFIIVVLSTVAGAVGIITLLIQNELSWATAEFYGWLLCLGPIGMLYTHAVLHLLTQIPNEGEPARLSTRRKGSS